MIYRLWRGCTTPDDAPRYEAIVRGEVIPEIEARQILERRDQPAGT